MVIRVIMAMEMIRFIRNIRVIRALTLKGGLRTA